MVLSIARSALIVLIAMLTITSLTPPKSLAAESQDAVPDVHSFSNPEKVRVRHVDLDWNVLFDQKKLEGTAILTVERVAPGDDPLILDTRDLAISKVEASSDGKSFAPVEFELGPKDPFRGQALQIALPRDATRVRIAYATSPGASGLQWLSPEQTAGRQHPFLFTQSQAIHARSWIPLQDTPQVRVTYTARVRTPKDLLAVMSAENDPKAARDGDYSFKMAQPIPSYLIALGVGDLAFEPIGARSGVYAEPPVVKKAAREFADTEKMIETTERLFGPYRWGRYDILVLPPSFPFGGMENPRLTFATPTILAGDKSLVSLIAHELAHSWSGNLVTNATWSDLWLNEGFTVYVERRIVEALYGTGRERMEAVLGRQSLQRELDSRDPKDQILHIDLEGRDPDDVFSNIPYEKGALFLTQLETTFGRERFDRFLRGYFDHFAFKSITSEEFVAYLEKNLLAENPKLAERIPVRKWIYEPGLPDSAPKPQSDAFAKVDVQAKAWLEGKIRATKVETKSWSTQEWLHFLRSLPKDLGTERMKELDRAFKLTHSGNAEIAHVWLLMAIRNDYSAADDRLETYLTTIGRQKLIRPLYQELVKTPEGKARARAIYSKARPGYHPIAQTAMDQIVLE